MTIKNNSISIMPKLYNSRWFADRGMTSYSYQENAINEVAKSLTDNDITVLAACPASGKTIMSIHILDMLIKDNPNLKVLVLAHATNVLRDQYYESCVRHKPTFKFNTIQPGKLYDKNSNVNITLPQTAKKIHFEHLDLLVIDEGHEWYTAKTIQDILKSFPNIKKLALTGTPSKFIGMGIKPIIISVMDIIDSKRFGPVNVELVSSRYEISYDDLNKEGELNKEVRNNLRELDTKISLDRLLERMVQRLNVVGWKTTLISMKKTLIACSSQHQAMQVFNYFQTKECTPLLSISNVPDEDAFNKFKTDPSTTLLIVVKRGILGFNFPDLINVVDMTLSHNIDRTYQLFCRVIRANTEMDKKLFIKITPSSEEMQIYYKYVMNAVLELCHHDFMENFNGKNLTTLPIPIVREIKHSGKRKKPTSKKTIGDFIIPVMYDEINVWDLLKDITSDEPIFNTYSYTTLAIVKEKLFGIHERGKWSINIIKELAKQYPNMETFKIKEPDAYRWIKLFNLYTELRLSMNWKLKRPNRNKWTFDKIIERAKSYSDKKTFLSKENGAYQWIKGNNLLKEFYSIMEWKLRYKNVYLKKALKK